MSTISNSRLFQVHILIIHVVASLGIFLWSHSPADYDYVLERIIWRRWWCNGYRRKKWIRAFDSKYWTWLNAFNIVRILLVNSKVDWSG